MEKKICVYTCITGNYDDVQEILVKEKNIDYFLFTNNKNIKSNTWKVIYIEDKNLDNHYLSRKIKMLGHPLIDNKYEVSVWIDACVTFQKSIRKFVETYYNEKEAPFSAFKHCIRNCIYDEAYECIKLRKDSKEKIIDTINFLRKENYPENNGLYEMTVFIKNHNDPLVQKTMKLWFDMICKYSKRDQLSFMYCIWKTKMKVKTIDLNVWDNSWFLCDNHTINTKIKDYRVYFGDENKYQYENDIHGSYDIDGATYKFKIKIPVTTNITKIEISKVPYVYFENIKINNIQVKDYIVDNYINYNGNKLFYNQYPIILINKMLYKDDYLSFSIKLRKLTKKEIDTFIEYIIFDNLVNKRKLEKELSDTKLELTNIKNSRSWKITRPLRAITNLIKNIKL